MSSDLIEKFVQTHVRFEIHHLIPIKIFENEDYKAILHAAGIKQEMRGNLVALFAAEDRAIVDAFLELPDDEKARVVDARWGFARHDSQVKQA